MLPEDDADAFHLFMEWIYQGQIDPIDRSTPESIRAGSETRVKLYCFASKICLPDLMDDVMSVICGGYASIGQHMDFLSSVVHAFTNTDAESLIRRFMIDRIVYVQINNRVQPRYTKALYEAVSTCEDLGIDLLTRLGPLGKCLEHYDPLREDVFCRWHVHSGEKICRYPDPKSLPFDEGPIQRKSEVPCYGRRMSDEWNRVVNTSEG